MLQEAIYWQKKTPAFKKTAGIKKLPTHKPDSVQGYHLSAMVITEHLFLPTLDGSRFRDRTSSSQTDPIHGISASKVYPHYSLLNSAAGSYPAFSPFPPQKRR